IFYLFQVIEVMYHRHINSQVFILLAIYMTVIHNFNYLKKVEDLSLFLPSWTFLKECMMVPGGGLIWGGTFLTQFFYYPWLGGAVFIALLLVLQYLVGKAFRIPDRYFTLSFVPSALLLLALVQLGYVVYILKSPGYAFSNLLGMIAVVGSFWVYRCLKHWLWRGGVVILFSIVGYPILGFYALLVVILFAIDECTQKRVWWAWNMLVAIIAIALVPLFYYILVYTQLMCDSLYTSVLPRFYPNEMILWMPFGLLYAYVIFLAFYAHRWKQKTERARVVSVVLALIVFVMALGGAWYYEFDDENFRITIDMDRAILDNDWQKVVDCAQAQQGEPTRLIVLNTDMALYKLGQAGDRMFKFKINGVPYRIIRTTPVMRNTGAKALYFQYGKINYCYRWCMEDKVEYGMKVEYLKYMVKCALLNEEFALAQKYNSTLAQTLFHKDWAEKYQRYIDEPQLMAEDAEFKMIKPLMAYNNALEGDGGLLEAYLISQIAYMEGGPPELVELSLQCNLVQKDIARFWPRFILYARTHDRLPLHYQEAAILYSYLERKVDYRQFKIEDEVVTRFDKFIKLSEQMAGQSDEKSKEVFKPYFSDTFWYYYFFVKGLKTS
ncbi:DUF6057 family protein, partial [Bacteroides salyersiae]|uniref:DUF6057 family protein n=1 Tax=Bacteroides salyersiae TaxID=291644 RepID=UPI001865146A